VTRLGRKEGRKEGTDTRDRHPRGLIGQLGRESGKRAASGKRPRKEESGGRGDQTLGKEKARRGEPTGLAGVAWVTCRCRRGRLGLRAK
jgi:hypothetical protein